MANCRSCGGSGVKKVSRYDKYKGKTVKIEIKCGACGGTGKVKSRR